MGPAFYGPVAAAKVMMERGKGKSCAKDSLSGKEAQVFINSIFLRVRARGKALSGVH